MLSHMFLFLIIACNIIICRSIASSDSEVCFNGTCDVGISPTLEHIPERRRQHQQARQSTENTGMQDQVPTGPSSTVPVETVGEVSITSLTNDDMNRLIKDAMAAHAAGRPEKAISMLSQLRQQLGPSVEMAEAEMFHGMVLAQQWRGAEALDCWQRALTILDRITSRSTEELVAFRGHVSVMMFRAAEHFSSSANDESQDPSSHGNGRIGLHMDAAKLCNAVGNTDRAIDHLETALRLNPDHALAMYVLGSLRNKQGRSNEAQRLMQTATELQKGNTAGVMIAAARACEQNDLEACHRRFLIAYEYAYADGNLPVASRAVASAITVLLQLHGEAGISQARMIGEKAVAQGVLNAPLQVPGTLILGLTPAKAYHDDSKAWQVVRVLEEHAAEIRDEVLAAYHAGKLSDQYEYDSVADLPLRGHWAEINILRQGMPQSRIVELLPITSRVVLSIPDAVTMVHGGSKVSVIDGGSLVRPHTGCCNSRLRVHMGITVPDDCGIIVDGEERSWVEGQCMVFDDSFVHSVWQNSTEVRIILIVDIWHPMLDEAAREATMLDETQLEWYRHIQRMMSDGSWMESAGRMQHNMINS